MEPQGGNISPLPATKRIGRQRKTTRRSRVHAQSVWLNAERKICRHRAEGEIFLLTFPYIGRLRGEFLRPAASALLLFRFLPKTLRERHRTLFVPLPKC